MSHVVSFCAWGVPSTQGSAKAFVRGGRAYVTHDSGDKLRSWRSVVAAEAHTAMNGRSPLDAPVEITVKFYLPRPKSAPKSRTLPDRKPDLDKLARAIGDAIEGIVYTQDSRICRWMLSKHYGDPRAHVSVSAL